MSNLVTVALDAGHGRNSRTEGVFDPGAESGNLRESTLAFRLLESGVFVASTLFAGRIKTVLTRDTIDESAPLRGRTQEAANEGADFLLSLHLNSGPTTATGIETFYRTGDIEDKSLAFIAQRAAVSAFGLRDRGVKSEADSQYNTLAILRGATVGIPACLLEAGFITNPGDVAAIFSDEARDARIKFWSAVYSGLLTWKG